MRGFRLGRYLLPTCYARARQQCKWGPRIYLSTVSAVTGRTDSTYLTSCLMQDIMPNYQYKPLQHEDSIRLLSLRPSSADSSPITCTIRHVRLTEVVSQYEAISYTWGNVAQRQSIFVDHGESELQIGPSCYSALRNLRKKNYNRDIWIDAICIDQENLEERSKQVRIMDSIYRQASRVIAYLGEETTGSRVLFQELAEVDASLSIPSTATLTRERPKEMVSQELASLFERPWFRRVWVLQEAHVNKVLFMCGSTAASWSALVECLWGYQDHEIPALAFRMQWRKPVIYSDARFTLWGLLYDSRHCLATDPRDKVFALRSLMGNQKAELDKLVDYTRSVEQTFIRTAEFLLPALGLHLLTAVRHPHSFLMPSWIPDFAQHLPLHTKFFKLSFWEHLLSDIRLNAIRGPYRVRGSFHNGSESLRMHVRGLRLAVIRYVSGRFTFSCLNDAGKQMKELYYYLPNLRELFIPINDSVPDGRSLESFSNQLGRIITEGM